VPVVELNYNDNNLQNDMDNISKLMLNKDKNKESFKQSPIPNKKNEQLNFNKIELTNSSDSKKHTRENSSNKEELLLESVDDDE